MEFDDVRDADAGKIKKAYNKAMIKIHPDKWQSQSAMPQGLKDRLREFYDRLQYAYTVLRDDERKRAYAIGGIAEVHIVEEERKEEGNTIDQPVLRAPRHKALNPAEIPQTLRQMELMYNRPFRTLQDLILWIWPAGTSTTERNALAQALAKCPYQEKVSAPWTITSDEREDEHCLKLCDPLPPEWGDKCHEGGKYAYWHGTIISILGKIRQKGLLPSGGPDCPGWREHG